MTVAMIYGFGVSFFMYFWTVARGEQLRMSGNFIYDVFMGAALNPRIGHIDLKMWAEVRIPWVIVFFLAVSGACKQYELYGYVTPVRRFASNLNRTSHSYFFIRTWHSCALRRGSISMPGKYVLTQLLLLLIVCAVAKVKSAFHRRGICSMRSGVSWSSSGTLPVFLSCVSLLPYSYTKGHISLISVLISDLCVLGCLHGLS
jgi:hypothetical protein